MKYYEINESTAHRAHKMMSMQRFKGIYDFCFWLLALSCLVFLLCFRLTFALGESMEPTLSSGQFHVFFRFAEPKVGDIVLFHAPHGDSSYIKRVVAVPGDTVEHDTGCLVLDKHQYYVVGDNRAVSYDSRAFGPVSGESILGVMVF